MRISLKIIIKAALAAAFCVFASLAQVTVKQVPSGKLSIVPSLGNPGQVQAAIPEFCEALGFRWQWDFFNDRLTCTKNSARIIFTQDISFYSLNGVACPLPDAPHRSGASLYLSPGILIDILRPHIEGDLQWESVSGVVTVNTAHYSIQSVVCDKKQNGTLITLALRDSVPFDFTYFYPNLTLNFFGGTVDTGQIRQGKRIGVVDSVFAVQFKASAQVSFILSREIADPQIDYVQDTRTVMVSLRPKAQPVKAKAKSVLSELPDQSLRTIVIDPGHGGKDPGAIGVAGTKEKDIVLAIGLHLRDLLRKKSDMKVHMTREKDVFVPLGDRTKFANEKRADLFVSLHADAVPGTKGRKEATRGYKVYFLSQAKNEEDKMAAMRENAVIELEDKPQNYNSLQTVLIDLAGNEYLRQSQDLSILLDQQFDLQLKKISKLHLGVGQANFWVLNGAYMPSILIEVGFLSHPGEEKLMANTPFQKEIASAICGAILNFQHKYETGL